MKLILNIGLTNNPFDWIYIARMMAYHTHGVEVEHAMLKQGSYKGQKEDTLVCHLKQVKLNQEEIRHWIELLCMALNQECIAVRGYKKEDSEPAFEWLVYDPTLDIQRNVFDNKYFIE